MSTPYTWAYLEQMGNCFTLRDLYKQVHTSTFRKGQVWEWEMLSWMRQSNSIQPYHIMIRNCASVCLADKQFLFLFWEIKKYFPLSCERWINPCSSFQNKICLECFYFSYCMSWFLTAVRYCKIHYCKAMSWFTLNSAQLKINAQNG